MERNIKPYNPSLGTPGRTCVTTYSGEHSRDLPKSWTEARDSFQRAQNRRGGAQGKLTHNTWIEERRDVRHKGSGSSFAVVLHRTAIVTFHPDGSIELDSGGWQTATTRDRMNRCGVLVAMGGGVPTVAIGKNWRTSKHVPFVDGMRLGPKTGEVSYPAGYAPVGNVADILSRRSRLLAKARRNPSEWVDVSYWPGRQGGQMPHGTVREVFKTDSECGLKPRTRRGSAQ